MTYKTMQQLITATEKALYQSAGSQVQLYSQDIIMQQLQDAFNHVFDLHWWPRFISRQTLVLDGVTGQSTTTITDITDYRDIRYIFTERSTRPLSKLVLDYNTNEMVGDFARFVEGTNDAKLFRVWPLTSTNTLNIVGRARPVDFIITDTVPFDDTLLKHFAAWSYFTDDASNPAAADKHQGLFENRLKYIEDSEMNEPILLNTDDQYIPDRWTESRW